MAKVKGQGGREGEINMIMDLITLKMLENLKKMADQLPRQQVPLVLEKAASPASTAVSHICPLNSLSGSRLTRLMR